MSSNNPFRHETSSLGNSTGSTSFVGSSPSSQATNNNAINTTSNVNNTNNSNTNNTNTSLSDNNQNDEIPDEEPPPYSLLPEEGSETVIPASGPLILPRPSDYGPVSPSASSASSASTVAPPHPPRPAPRPVTGSSGYPGNNRPTFNGQPVINSHPVHAPPFQGHGPVGPSPGLPPRPRPPFQYPRGYWCHKCHNTGIKLKNGLTCQDCYGRFARQSNVVHQLPPSHGFQSPLPPRVVRPGDPAIGGVLCGRCRGRGLVYDFIFEDTCPTCRGIGRLL